MKELKLSERLIVAADFKPTSGPLIECAHDLVIGLAKKLKNTGVIIKENTVLRAFGYGHIGELHDLGVRVMADLKLDDTPETLVNDANFLRVYEPELLTVMCSAGHEALKRLKAELTDKTEVLGVTLLTSFDKIGCRFVFGRNPDPAVMNFAELAETAGLDGVVCSGKELDWLTKVPFMQGMSLNVPGIRPEWAIVEGDDQKRVVTPAEAISRGATRVVIGRPITQADDPLVAVQKTLHEIDQALG